MAPRTRTDSGDIDWRPSPEVFPLSSTPRQDATARPQIPSLGTQTKTTRLATGRAHRPYHFALPNENYAPPALLVVEFARLETAPDAPARLT